MVFRGSAPSRRPPPIPPTLIVDQESRFLTLRCDTLEFGLPSGEPRVYFDFGVDTLVLFQHFQLSHTLTSSDLSRLRHVIVPEVKVDDPVNYKALDASTDCLFQQHGSDDALVDDSMSGAMPEEQVTTIFESSRPVLDAVCPMIEQKLFSPITTCSEMFLRTSFKNCSRNFC